jgi:hypothetical protein
LAVSHGDRQAIDQPEAMLDGSEHQITNVSPLTHLW